MSEEELFLQQIGQRIMERRKKLGLTQEALAEKGDVTTQFVSYAEAGKRAMRPENLLKIASALGVSTDYILIICCCLKRCGNWHHPNCGL